MLRQTRPPLIAVVRLRKSSEWVFPKGKLDDGETPRDAASAKCGRKPVTMCRCMNFWERWPMAPADDPRSFIIGGWKPRVGRPAS